MFYIHKEISETPLDALKRFRRENPRYQEARLSYAGRLDPMAEGTLLILEGDENDRRSEYLSRAKSYEFQILFGAATDSFDLLGLVTDFSPELPVISRKEVSTALESFVGECEMRYPPYSAKTVESRGKMVPLWQLARAKQLPDVLPSRMVEIFSARCSKVGQISGAELQTYLQEAIPKVTGDFRQKKILHTWRSLLEDKHVFSLAHCRIGCSAGTYIRRLAAEIVSQPSLAFRITRTGYGTASTDVEREK